MDTFKLEKPIALVGPMGAGKSTLMRLLSQTLQLDAIDVDCKIEEFAHKKISDIFKEDGEEYFRNLESDTLKYCLDCAQIIATGGGIIGREKNRLLLKEAFVIYLYTPIELQYQRTLVNNDRPMLEVTDRLQRLKDLFTVRHPLYQSVSDIVIDTSLYDAKGCVALIIDLLGKHKILHS